MSALHLSLEDDDPWIVEQMVFDIINRFLQPSSGVTSQSAAHDIDNLVPANRASDGVLPEEEENTSTFLWNIWPVFFKIAQQIPYSSPNQDKLVDLVKTLKNMSPRTPEVVVTYWQKKLKLWQDLPSFGEVLREEYGALDRMVSDERHLKRQRNLNAFMTRLTKDEIFSFLGYATRALGILDGREVRRHEHTKAITSYDFEPSPELVFHVSIALDWLKSCGSILVQKIKQNSEHVESADGDSAELLPELSLERWTFWEGRFKELSASETIDEQSRELGKEASSLMKSLGEETLARGP